MKKILCITLLLCVFLPCVGVTAFATEDDFVAYDVMKEFVSLHPYRKSGTENEKKAGEYIKNFFETIGYETDVQEFEFNLYSNVYGSEDIVEDRNYVARLDSDANKTIVIGAHYDNVFSSGSGQGAYDNGSGVGILLNLAKTFYGETLPFDIEFVAFGGEENGMYGSNYYLSSMTSSRKDNILLYINLDSILAGDKVYMYCDEVKTYHEQYFLSVANGLGVNIDLLPEYKAVAGVYMEGDKLPYTHVGLMSDNATFFNQGILSVSFSSYNYTREVLEQVNESVNFDNVMHTEKDNIQAIENMYGDDAKNKMKEVYSVVKKALFSSDFIEKMNYAKQNNLNYTNIVNGKIGAVISVCIIAILIVAIWIYCAVNKRKNLQKIQIEEESKKPPQVFSDF